MTNGCYGDRNFKFWLSLYLCTCAGSEPHPSQEDVAGQGLFIPHGELQADVVEVAGLQAAVGEGVVPLRVDGASLHLRLVLG